MSSKCWVNTVSREHVLKGVEGGFTQADHGDDKTLKKLAKGDWVVFYSPRTAFRKGEPLHKFTAIGRIVDDKPYQVEMSPDFRPWRRKTLFLPGQEAAVKPLVGELTFIRDKQHWGFPFRHGLFEIDCEDFERIARAMNAGEGKIY